jgi:hypothetical protein
MGRARWDAACLHDDALKNLGNDEQDSRLGEDCLRRMPSSAAHRESREALRHDFSVLGDADMPRPTLLDPFCGTGVVIQEAALMGFDAYGTDLEPRMIDFSRHNLDWLAGKVGEPAASRLRGAKLAVADATTFTWQAPIDFVVSETYLGQAFSATPSPAKLRAVMTTCDTITRKFLLNIAPQLRPETRLTLAVPAWFVGGKTYHLPLIKDLDKLGYTPSPAAPAEPLIYHRAGQIVGRELLVLARKAKL